MGNQQMITALQYAGYDCHLEWHEGNHGTGAFLIPEMLRWHWGSSPTAKL